MVSSTICTLRLNRSETAFILEPLFCRSGSETLHVISTRELRLILAVISVEYRPRLLQIASCMFKGSREIPGDLVDISCPMRFSFLASHVARTDNSLLFKRASLSRYNGQGSARHGVRKKEQMD